MATECSWVETSGEAAVENITAEEARQTALNKARAKAVENISGINIQGSSMVKDFSLVADFVSAMASGYIVEEKVENWESKSLQEKSDVPPVTVYKVNLKTCVKAGSAGDPYFKVKAELNKPVFLSGDEAKITATCTRDCYLTILNVTADNRISVLYPDKQERALRLKAGTSYTFPSNPGLALEVSPLPGHKKDAEAFYVVATKEKFDLPALVKTCSSITSKELYTNLFSLPADTRAETLVMYEVRARE